MEVMLKIVSMFVILITIDITYATDKEDFKRKLGTKPEAVNLPNTISSIVTEVSYACVPHPDLVACYFSRIKEGKFVCSDSFNRYVFCVLTNEQINYADKDTGLWNAERIGKLFPKRCKIFELTTFCNNQIQEKYGCSNNNVKKFAANYRCYQRYGLCDPNLKP